jgi:hypothetical protein
MTSEDSASMISFVFNPAVIAAFAFVILLYPERDLPIYLPLLGMCVTFGTLIPLVMMLQFSKRRLISDFYVSEKEERAKPFAGAIASYVVGSVVLLLVRAPTIVTALMLCYAGNTVILMLITFRWKISVHAFGIACPTTVLVYGAGIWAAVFFALLLPVGWARIHLNAHTSWQMLAGALVSIAATWMLLGVYLSIL